MKASKMTTPESVFLHVESAPPVERGPTVCLHGTGGFASRRVVMTFWEKKPGSHEIRGIRLVRDRPCDRPTSSEHGEDIGNLAGCMLHDNGLDGSSRQCPPGRATHSIAVVDGGI
jgi:hypothetical protein